jgi:uncharacterized protein (DUF1330 family)
MNRKKIILTIVLFLVLLTCGIGYYLYNKGPVDVQDSDSIKINAAELYDAYIKDLAAAQKKYTGRILEITGEVHDVSVNQQQKKILLLKSHSDGAYVNCTMEENTENIHANDKVNVKGICSGIGEGDVDLGIKGDVYLTRCYLVK